MVAIYICTCTNLQIPGWNVPGYTTNSCPCVSAPSYLLNSLCKLTASQHRCPGGTAGCSKRPSSDRGNRKWRSTFSWEPLRLTSSWHHRIHYCQYAYFPKGLRAAWFSALSGLSGQDTNLSSIKIAVGLFFCLACTVRLLGKGFLGIISTPGYSQPFLVIQYQNNTLSTTTPPCSSNQRCWYDDNCTPRSQFTLPVSLLPLVHFVTISFFSSKNFTSVRGDKQEKGHVEIFWWNDSEGET